MGHYDDDYADQERAAQEKRTSKFAAAALKLEELTRELPPRATSPVNGVESALQLHLISAMALLRVLSS